jgi:hypothetical protein
LTGLAEFLLVMLLKDSDLPVTGAERIEVAMSDALLVFPKSDMDISRLTSLNKTLEEFRDSIGSLPKEMNWIFFEGLGTVEIAACIVRRGIEADMTRHDSIFRESSIPDCERIDPMRPRSISSAKWFKEAPRGGSSGRIVIRFSLATSEATSFESWAFASTRETSIYLR